MAEREGTGLKDGEGRAERSPVTEKPTISYGLVVSDGHNGRLRRKTAALCLRKSFKWQVSARYNKGVPGKAGIHVCSDLVRRHRESKQTWTPAFAGATVCQIGRASSRDRVWQYV